MLNKVQKKSQIGLFTFFQFTPIMRFIFEAFAPGSPLINFEYIDSI